MDLHTHLAIDPQLVGRAVLPEAGRSVVTLETIPVMAADETGLVHGGFVFGAADYAAMTAVNHPNVVLGAAEVKFLKPVQVGEVIEARAQVVSEQGRKRVVEVQAFRGEQIVFSGTFICFVLEKHVLS
ncbi:MAG: hotdog domain-containing protein [Thermodesulfobacteriota bacterium]